MLFVTHNAIKALFLPHGSTRAKALIDPFRGKLFPTLQDVFQGIFIAFKRSHQQMNVIGHHGIGRMRLVIRLVQRKPRGLL